MLFIMYILYILSSKPNLIPEHHTHTLFKIVHFPIRTKISFLSYEFNWKTLINDVILIFGLSLSILVFIYFIYFFILTSKSMLSLVTSPSDPWQLILSKTVHSKLWSSSHTKVDLTTKLKPLHVNKEQFIFFYLMLVTK